MGWKSVPLGFAAVMACGLAAWAQSASPSDASAPALRLSVSQSSQQYRGPVRIQGESAAPEQPRYATMIPPTGEEDASVATSAPASQTAAPASPPVAAPSARVAASPIEPPPAALTQSAAPSPGTPLRYSTMEEPPRPYEQVTVTGLRPSEDTLYRLGPGDKLRVTVFNEGDLSGEFAIDGQGFVRLPLIGQVQAAGLTTFGLESRIAGGFVNGGYLISPRVSVEIMSYRPFYIIGEVSKPGEYAYVNAMTAPNAIALAGGYTDRATESTIWVRHEGETSEREVAADETTRILPGDVIRVRRSTYWAIMSVLAPIISPFTAVAYLLK